MKPNQDVAEPERPISSFVAIQQLQHDQATPVSKDRQSLREIQEEERARQAEAEFLQWWAAEEERTKLEMAGSSQNLPAGKKKARASKRNTAGSSKLEGASSLSKSSRTARSHKTSIPSQSS